MDLALILLLVLIGVGAIVYAGLSKPPRRVGPDATAGDGGVSAAPSRSPDIAADGDGGGGD